MGLADLQEDLRVGRIVGSLSFSLYALGFGLGPLVLAPISEVYGRNPMYLGSTVLFTRKMLPPFQLFSGQIADYLEGSILSSNRSWPRYHSSMRIPLPLRDCWQRRQYDGWWYYRRVSLLIPAHKNVS